MKKIYNGGPAHPTNDMNQLLSDGMSLRQWYAGQAMKAIVTKYGITHDRAEGALNGCRIEDHVRDAFEIADAMIAFEAEEEGGQ